MEADLQKRFENMGAFEVITDLKDIFASQASAERYEASELFFLAKIEAQNIVSEHVVKMFGYIQRPNALEHKIPNELATDKVMQFLNYNMQGMTKSLSELFAMLKIAEVEIKKEHTVLMVNKTVNHKKSGKNDKDGKSETNGKPVSTPSKAPKPGVECFHCKWDGHWKHNCPKYLEDKKAEKIAGKDKIICDIYFIDVYLTSARSNTWVFDTGFVSHICNS
jgi:hypothetical protein